MTIPITDGQGNKPSADAPKTGVQIILDDFRARYRPVFKIGTDIHTPGGEVVRMVEACGVADSNLIDKLATATDAPRLAANGKRDGGDVKRASLPAFFKTWSRIAWGDLLGELKDEDAADLKADSATAETFRRLVKDALLSEKMLGDTIGKRDDITRTERRSVADWCVKFAKPGPWRSIRSLKVWCRTVGVGGGEIQLKVALRVELFGQLRADRRLCSMPQNSFARKCERYGVGTSTRDDRPQGLSAVVLSPEFVADLTDGIANEPETEEERHERLEREAIDTLGGG